MLRKAHARAPGKRKAIYLFRAANGSLGCGLVRAFSPEHIDLLEIANEEKSTLSRRFERPRPGG